MSKTKPSVVVWMRMPGLQLVELLGKEQVWPCWRKYGTGGRLWGFKSLRHSQLVLSVPCSWIKMKTLRYCASTHPPACRRAPCLNGHGLQPSDTVSTQKMLSFVSCLVMVSYHSNGKATRHLHIKLYSARLFCVLGTGIDHRPAKVKVSSRMILSMSKNKKLKPYTWLKLSTKNTVHL